MKPIDDLYNSGFEDDYSGGSLARDAKEFLTEQRWCREIVRGYVDRFWEGILGVFFFEIIPQSPDVDGTVWIVTGDLPPAYLCNDNQTGADALNAYLCEMRRWVDAVRFGRSTDDLIPVDAPATPEYAAMLASRLDFIHEKILPYYDDKWT